MKKQSPFSKWSWPASGTVPGWKDAVLSRVNKNYEYIDVEFKTPFEYLQTKFNSYHDTDKSSIVCNYGKKRFRLKLFNNSIDNKATKFTIKIKEVWRSNNTFFVELIVKKIFKARFIARTRLVNSNLCYFVIGLEGNDMLNQSNTMAIVTIKAIEIVNYKKAKTKIDGIYIMEPHKTVTDHTGIGLQETAIRIS